MKKNLMEMYGHIIQKMFDNSDPELNLTTTAANVLQEAIPDNRAHFETIINDLVLPGSGIEGIAFLDELKKHSDEGHACLICSAHFTNFDVPALYTLMKRLGPAYENLFDRFVFVAGKKLTETSPQSKALTEMFSRVVIVPKEDNMTEQAKKKAFTINRAAQRIINQLKKEGRILLIYPNGTRVRPWDPHTFRGLREAYNYIRNFDYFICCGLSGTILPPTNNPGLIFDYPQKDTVIYRFGPLHHGKSFVQACTEKAKEDQLDTKQHVIDTIMEEIYSLGDDPRVQYKDYTDEDA
jgi:1-acyl-sn-glycerol-3-phosphate acyltransferase